MNIARDKNGIMSLPTFFMKKISDIFPRFLIIISNKKMSGSFLLKQRNLLGSAYDVSNFGAVDTELGGWSSHYVKNLGLSRCHPNYEAIPIGNNPLGFAICRKKVIDGRTLDLPAPHVTGENNGYHKFASDLYNPKAKTQTQMYNPDY